MSVVEVATAVLVAGVDEVGRGPLAGPVVVAAVILDPLRQSTGLPTPKCSPPNVAKSWRRSSVLTP